VLQFPLVTVIWPKQRVRQPGSARHNYQLFALITMMDYNTLPVVQPVAARKTGPADSEIEWALGGRAAADCLFHIPVYSTCG